MNPESNNKAAGFDLISCDYYSPYSIGKLLSHTATPCEYGLRLFFEKGMGANVLIIHEL
jgi:hypothetical protein